MNRKLTALSLCATGALAIATACASAPPPRELNDAHAAFTRAATGDAPKLSPAALYDARQALDEAEAAYKQRSPEFMVRDKAYVAIRRAEIAEVLASTERARQNEARANVQSNDERSRALREANAESAGKESSATERRVAESANPELDKRTREQAERAAHQALDKLAKASSVAVKDEARGTVISVPNRVLFATGRSDFLPGAQAELEPVAEALRQESDHRIVVEGHTDSAGSDALNRTLSQKRAEAVRELLVEHGVRSDRVTASGAGDSKPIGDNGTDEGRASNRRVEIVVEAARAP